MAQSSPTAVARGVRDLAVQRGWKPVEELATAILSARGAEQILLTPGAGVDATPLRQWLVPVTGAECAQCQISRIATAPHPALFASKLIAVFECGRLLEASEVKTLVAQFLPRPLESFAIVFVCAERLETPQDLDLMERAIWRVLVLGAKRDWRGQDLSTCQCYLWAGAPPRNFLRERCERDRARLAAVLCRPTGAADAASLDRRRVVQLLDLAAAQVPTEPRRGDDQMAVPRQLRDEIAQLRRRLARRLDAGASELSRRAVVALLEAERQLVTCAEATWKDPTAMRNATNGGTAGAMKPLGRHLEAQMHSWRAGFEAELNERVNAIVADTRALLREPMSRAAANCRPEQWDRLAAGPGDISLEAFLPRLQYRAGTVERPAVPGLIAQATALTAVTGLAALSAGVIATVVVSAVLSTSIVVRGRNRSLEHSRRVMRRAVHDVTERAVPQVRAAIQEAIGRYRDRLVGALREIEFQIEPACERQCLAQAAVPGSFSDREQLLEYRRRL